MIHTSAIFSEPIYIMGGYYYLSQGETFDTGHPILTHIIAATPLLFLHLDAPDPASISHPYEFARKEFLYYGNNDPDTILFWARIPFLFLSFFFACYVFRWVRELYGIIPATSALVLYIFNPDIIWASTVVMTDLSLAGFMFVSCYYLWKYLKTNKRGDFFFWALFFALALASKSTALFAIPIYASMYLIYKGIPYKKILKDFLLLGCIVLLVFTIINIRDIHPLYDATNPFYAQSPESRSDARLQNLTEEFTNSPFLQKTLIFLMTKVPVPGEASFSAYAAQFRHRVTGQAQYFMGEYSNHGVWYYYFFEYLVKTPFSLLLLLTFSLFLFMHLKTKEWKDELTLLAPIIIFLGITSFMMKLNLGLRHTLIVHFFLIVFVAKVFQYKKYENKVLPFLLGGLLICYIIFSLLFAPSYIAYFNSFLSPQDAPQFVIGDSMDLGQDLINLGGYMKDNNLTEIKLRYAGFEHPEYRNITYENLSCEPTTGMLAVSVDALYGGSFWYEGNQTIDQKCYAWLQQQNPITRIGYTIYIYNITEEDLSFIQERD